MPSTFFGLEIGKRGIFAQQGALQVTGHNIANANTGGYSRQRAEMVATPAIPYPSATNDRQAGQLGTGVTVSSLQRLRERFLDIQFRDQNTNVGYYEKKTDTLEKIEVLLNEPSDKGFQYSMDQFWNSWQKVSSTPKDQAARETLRQNAVAMTENFTFIHSSLVKTKNNLNDEVQVTAQEIDSYARQIASLNKQIGEVVPHGYQPNDLYDQRDMLIDKLSKIVDISVTEVDNGMVNITLNAASLGPTPGANPQASPTTTIPLVTGKDQMYVHAIKDGNGMYQVRVTDTKDYASTSKTKEYAAIHFTSGELGGLLESRGDFEYVKFNGTEWKKEVGTGTVDEFIGRMNSLATEMFKAVNEVHKNGYNLDDLTNGTKESLAFFTTKSGKDTPDDASDFQVNPKIMESVRKIAIASKQDSNNTDEPIPGEEDNRNALAIFALKHKDINFGTETTSFDGYTKGTIANLGIQTREAQRMLDNTAMLAGEVENRRQSVSGVSLDEEMSNMIKFQHAYSASARMITAVDEMLDKIINGMGLVGR
ncbi:flagellar hook-associated protein FlgK [Aneurinibacillus sp. BA2021]|nr:flagellar hook-associated protein FlgK [Aneurinibacillus sp. BA2021]